MTISYSKKICLIGDISVGKTSLIRRFVESRFDETYMSTIGVMVSRKQLTISHTNATAELTLLIWDLAGSEKFDRVVRSYYQGAAGAMLVCDLTRPATADALSNYAEHFWEVNPGRPLIIIANKVDLEEQRAISDSDLAARAGQLGTSWYTGSAKTGAGVAQAFQAIGEQVLPG